MDFQNFFRWMLGLGFAIIYYLILGLFIILLSAEQFYSLIEEI
jgi:hypothetical protein